jgi:hypothetical protein
MFDARIFIWESDKIIAFGGLGTLPGLQLLVVALSLPLNLFSGKSGSVIFLMQASCLLTTKKLLLQMAFIMNSNVIICEPNNQKY